jgi:RNA polymerase sigma factor (sigma-70 family)
VIAETLRAECERTITQLMQRHNWQLLDKSAFVTRLLARAQEREQVGNSVGHEPLNSLAVNEYCLVWHAACRQAGPQQARAYQEIAHYLYDRALHKYGDPDMAHDIAQDALLLIYEQIDNCRNPGAFMAFALLKLWNAATTYFRKRKRALAETLPNDDDAERDEAASDEAAPAWIDHSQPPLDESAANRELAVNIMRRVTDLLHASPRAHKQYMAVLYKFLHGYSDQEIAEALETDVAGVHVLRSRGLSRLRDDPILHELAEEGRRE